MQVIVMAARAEGAVPGIAGMARHPLTRHPKAGI